MAAMACPRCPAWLLLGRLGCLRSMAKPAKLYEDGFSIRMDKALRAWLKTHWAPPSSGRTPLCAWSNRSWLVAATPRSGRGTFWNLFNPRCRHRRGKKRRCQGKAKRWQRAARRRERQKLSARKKEKGKSGKRSEKEGKGKNSKGRSVEVLI